MSVFGDCRIGGPHSYPSSRAAQSLGHRRPGTNVLKTHDKKFGEA